MQACGSQAVYRFKIDRYRHSCELLVGFSNLLFDLFLSLVFKCACFLTDVFKMRSFLLTVIQFVVLWGCSLRNLQTWPAACVQNGFLWNWRAVMFLVFFSFTGSLIATHANASCISRLRPLKVYALVKISLALVGLLLFTYPWDFKWTSLQVLKESKESLWQSNRTSSGAKQLLSWKTSCFFFFFTFKHL